MENNHISSEFIELKLLLEAIYEKYGYDFRDYSKSHLKRRINHVLKITETPNIGALIHRVLNEEEIYQVLLKNLSINVTEMFRDPGFYRAVRKDVVPLLKTYPFIRIWHAGCATGEEVYSMAILLKEEGLYNRAMIYATDFNLEVLDIARQGIYSIDRIKDYTRNYIEAGGKKEFSQYYSSCYEHVKLNESLKKNIVFSDHNLVTDGVFGEMHMIVCRNVLIYFNKELQNKVLKLFLDSLTEGGFLCLGSKENLQFTEVSNRFKALNAKEKIYQKKYI